LEGKSIRKAMRENSEKIVIGITKKWRKSLLGGLDSSHLDLLLTAAKSHANCVATYLSELDDKIPDDHKAFRKKMFRPVCSTGIFSADEVEFLKNYGAWLEALTHGEIQPYTPAQEHFVQMANGDVEPNTLHEQIWWRYQERCKLEETGEF